MSDSLSPYARGHFLSEYGWAGGVLSPVSEDWSQRKIFRVTRNNRTAILMHAVPDDDPRSTPGHKLRDFITISNYLRRIECSAPQIYAQDLGKGMILVEDFGSDLFSDLFINQPAVHDDLYMLGTRALMHLYQKTEFIDIDVPDYFKSHVHKGRQRVIDWYMPVVRQQINSDGMVADFLSVLDGIEKQLPPVKRRFLHGDFHPGNLLWLPSRTGIAQLGLIDFQGAFMGPAPYDLVNILDDARRFVPDELRAVCLTKFSQELKGEERESFDAWYTVLACHFHCRVIGQAIKLAIKDQKTRLLDLMPILKRHLVRDLEAPILEPLKNWFIKNRVDFAAETPLDIEKSVHFIRSDAF